MGTAKIAITIEKSTLSRLDRLVEEKKYPNRSRAIREIIEDKIQRFERCRLEEECEKLDPAEEKVFAEEGMSSEAEVWPEY
ncbi:MAG: CopG family ribbon-helix-helix protein [Spirochaetia bacterium]